MGSSKRPPSQARDGTGDLTFYVTAESAQQAAYLVRMQLEMSEFLTRDAARAGREAEDDPTATVYRIDVWVKEQLRSAASPGITLLDLDGSPSKGQQ